MEITYVRFISVYQVLRCRVRTPLKQITKEPRRKRKIDELIRLSHFQKIIFLPPAGCIGAVLPAYFGGGNGNGLSLSARLYDQGKQYLLAQILNHLNIGFTAATAFDRLIAMGLIDLYEEEVGITIQLHALFEAGEFFECCFQTLA